MRVRIVLVRRLRRVHHRAYAGVGQKLEQQRVRRRAVDDMRAVHAGLEGIHAALQLGDHAAIDLAGSEHGLGLLKREVRDERILVGEVLVQAVDVGKEDDLVGVDRGGKVRKLLAEGLPKARILGYVGEKDQDPDAGECFGPPFMALEAAKKHGATMIVLLPDAPIDDDIAHDLLEAKLHGAMVVDIRTFYEHVVQRLPLSQITEEWLLQTEGFSLNTRGSLRRLKRAFDLFLSLMLLIPAAPIMLITALLIRLESPGPVIYRQDRVGLYEKEFTVYKFRSMRTDAEKNGAVWAAANDARVTRVGKFIRKVRIDELPQIWNIIKGDMSFIGPRPERMTFVKQLKEHIPYYSLRHTVKPGLTGWAQVCYPYGANEEDARHKLEYDLFYVKNISILLDIHIIFKTVGVVLFPKGAR